MRPDLLPGYRFCPSDQELIIHYLDKKVKNEPVSCTFAVNDFDLYSKHPWEIWDIFGGNHLVSELDKDRGLFFFTQPRKRSGKDSRFSRSFGGGTWHGEDAATLIKTADTELSTGLKKRFTYKNPKSPHSQKWIMFEFSLVGHSTDYVLCQLKVKDKDKKLSESEPASDLPKHTIRRGNQKQQLVEVSQNRTIKRKSEATTSGKNPRSKKPRQPSSDYAPEFGVSESDWANSGCKEQHGVNKLVGEKQSQSVVGEVLSNLMHEIEEVEIGSLEEFWSIPDEEVGWLDYGHTLADIFPPTLAHMGTNHVWKPLAPS
ncbi:unnamed protein product [Dovyalis caffra]|uniref:NAC domain-containing protein n=1 Tax=Dovyalis caffra TaxID=77055 RepID=A0AAV1R5D1_9ROSI|nr:unnamed protein product [Dovyalis caffra]